MMSKFNISLVLALILANTAVSSAAPKPSLAPLPRIWTLDVTFEHPQQIEVTLPGSKTPKRFWYTIMTLTNKSGKDVPFYPEVDLMTDTFKTYPVWKGVTKQVYNKIKIANQGKYPFLQSFDEIQNVILQGSDNTVDIAVILPDFDPKAKNIKLFIAGLSNETKTVEHPTIKHKDGRPLKIYLRKTLELNYALPGDKSVHSQKSLVYKGKRWIMR